MFKLYNLTVANFYFDKLVEISENASSLKSALFFNCFNEKNVTFCDKTMAEVTQKIQKTDKQLQKEVEQKTYHELKSTNI